MSGGEVEGPDGRSQGGLEDRGDWGDGCAGGGVLEGGAR